MSLNARHFAKRRTMSSEPISPSSPPSTSRQVIVRILLLIFAWYISSSFAIFLTKGILSVDNTRFPTFKFALTITAINNVIAYIAACTISSVYNDLDDDANVRRISILIGATTAAEIGLCNIALSLLTVSFATVLKGLAPLFVMTWGIIFGVLVLRAGLLTSMLTITIGACLAVVGESGPQTQLSNVLSSGLLAQLISALLSGFRWVLTQVFIKGENISNERLRDIFNLQPLSRALSPIETIRLTAPFTCLPLIPFIAIVEGPALVTWVTTVNGRDAMMVMGILLCIGVSVFFLLLAEYELVKVTSSLTVSVAFVLKEMWVIFAGGIILGERLSALTWVGFVVTQIGIVGYALQRRAALARRSSSKDIIQVEAGLVQAEQDP